MTLVLFRIRSSLHLAEGKSSCLHKGQIPPENPFLGTILQLSDSRRLCLNPSNIASNSFCSPLMKENLVTFSCNC